MPTYTQSNRYLKVTTPLGADALLLTGLHGHEALSQLFSFQLNLLAERSTTVSFDRLLGRPATVELTLQGGQKRYFNGIIKRLRQERQDEVFTHFQAELTPRFWLWTKRVRSRVFQNLSVPDILKTVLDGLEVSFSQLTGNYQPRNYCVQYRESDFAFASRLMEDEGIYYYFEHSANAHKMILADASSHSPDLPQQATLVFDQGEGGLRPEERIDRWDKSQELCAGKYALWDHHFELPGQYLAAEQPILSQATAGQVSHSLQVGDNNKLEIFDYPGGFAHRFDGINSGGGEQSTELQKVFQDNQRTVRLRMEEEAASGLWIEGGGTYRQMTPGYKFTLSRHFNGDGEYVLSRVEHEAAIHGDYSTGKETTLVYSNRFRCLPLNLPFRPPRQTPRPLVQGPQTATVIGSSQGSVGFTAQSNAAVGPSGDDIFCDRYGRVKVQFRWDRESKYSADSSCWVRVNQPWAGQQWGMITLPRVGQEVVVSFLEGDPDRPLILGSVYNAAQMPPFPLPAAKTQAGIKAHSQGNGVSSQTFSGLGFETALGEEHVHLHAERFMTQSAEHNLYVNAGQQHHVNIGRAASRQVGGLPGVNHSLTHGNPNQTTDSPPPSPPSPPPPPSPPSGGPHGWNPNIAGLLGWDLGLTLGWAEANVVGLNTKPTLGQTVTSNITPAGFIAAFGVPLPMAGTIAGVGEALGLGVLNLLELTAANVNLGNAVTFQFGSTLTVGSGYRLAVNNSPATWKLTPGTGLLAALYTGVTIADVIVPPLLPVNYKTVMGNLEVMAGGISALELILNLWAAFEGHYAGIATTKKTADEADTAAVVKTLQGDPLFGETCLAQLGHEIFLLDERVQAEASATTKICDSIYTIDAPQVVLRSNPALASAHASQIKLSALGNAAATGEVTIEAKTKTHVTGGAAAYLSLETTAPTDGTIVLDCGTLGKLTLQSGLTQQPNCLAMEPEGIGISSLLKLMLEVVENTLTMTPEGITLTAGDSVVEVTPAGITLTCGPTSIAITSAGIALDGPGVDLNADSSYSITSPMNQID